MSKKNISLLLICTALICFGFVPKSYAGGRKNRTLNLSFKVYREDSSKAAFPTDIQVINSGFLRQSVLGSWSTDANGVLNASISLPSSGKQLIMMSFQDSSDIPPKVFALDISSGKAGYLYAGRKGINGDCSNLIKTATIGNSLAVALRQPNNYLECQSLNPEDDVRLIGERNVNASDRNAFPPEADLELGASFHQELITKQKAENPLMADAEVNAYAQGLIKKLIDSSDGKGMPFKVFVIDADVLNAFAVPGGYVYVYRGLIEASSNEAELAGVLAHEISHIISRHGTESVTENTPKAALANLSSGLAQTIAQNAGGLKGLIAQLGGAAATTGIQAWVASSSRDFEREADHYGVQYAWKAGYNPIGLATFFQTLQSKRKTAPSRLEAYFSSHPLDDERIRNVREEIYNFLPADKKLISSSQDYLYIKQKLKNMPAPKASGQVSSKALLGLMSQLGMPANI